MYLFIFVAFRCQKLFFHNGAGGHFGFTPLEKNAGIFARDTGAKYFLKGSRKSNHRINVKMDWINLALRVGLLFCQNVIQAVSCSLAIVVIAQCGRSGVYKSFSHLIVERT